MAKPIFIITIPYEAQLQEVEHYRGIVKKLEGDYHVLLVGGDDLNFKMFSDKEIEPIQLEELKNIVSGT